MIRNVLVGMPGDGPNAFVLILPNTHVSQLQNWSSHNIRKRSICLWKGFLKVLHDNYTPCECYETCIDHTVAISNSYASQLSKFWWQRKKYLWESVTLAFLVSTSNLFYLDSLILSLFCKRFGFLRSTPYLCHCTPTCSKPTQVFINKWSSGLI